MKIDHIIDKTTGKCKKKYFKRNEKTFFEYMIQYGRGWWNPIKPEGIIIDLITPDRIWSLIIQKEFSNKKKLRNTVNAAPFNICHVKKIEHTLCFLWKFFFQIMYRNIIVLENYCLFSISYSLHLFLHILLNSHCSKYIDDSVLYPYSLAVIFVSSCLSTFVFIQLLCVF